MTDEPIIVLPLPSLALEPGPTRLDSYEIKIGREVTGFNGSIFLHVDYDPTTRDVHGVRLSEKSKDGSTLDGLLRAISDELTATLRLIRMGGREP